MNNREKNSNIKLLKIFLPVSVLLVLILILLYNFGTTSKQTAKLVVEDGMTAETADFAAQICEELDSMTRMGMAFCDMLSIMPIETPSDSLQIIGTLCNNSSAYMVVYCDTDGIGVTQSGIKVNVGKDNFLRTGDDKNQYYAYLQKEKIMQAEAVVSVIPVVKGETVKGYILMYYSVSHIRKLFAQNAAYDNAFLLFSVDDGIVITTEGLEEKPSMGTTLLQLLDDMDAKADKDQLRTAMENEKSIALFVKAEDESRYAIFTPIGINDWYISIGYEKALYDQKLAHEWGSMRNLITCLLILIFVFVFGMIEITVLTRIMYMKNSKKLRKEADMDLLTGLYNKMATERKIKQYLKDNPNLCAVFFILDIDDFKCINDSMGHSAGDAVLKSLGHYMKENYGDYHVVGRVGGDEFIIFVKDIETEKVLTGEIKKVSDVFQTLSSSDGVLQSITISIGSAVYPRDADNFEELYRTADKALYEAKKNGKNQLIKSSG